MRDVGEKFGIHALWLEDVLNTDHRPKVEELDNLMFMIMKIPSISKAKGNRVNFEQISIFLGKTFVISFQEHATDTFLSIKERLHKALGNIRFSKEDYLFYALIDRVVDDYYDVVENLGARVEALDEELRENFKGFDANQIILLRNEFLYLRKAALPIRDALKSILASKESEIDPKNKRYFRDAYDHAIHIVDAIDGYRELLRGQVDSYQNGLNLRMTEVMKVLTIFASIFAPLTFIAGIYGMNFKNMPELEWEYGYYFSLGLMLAVGLSLLYYFKRKDWL
jgi:magnesium transporter